MSDQLNMNIHCTVVPNENFCVYGSTFVTDPVVSLYPCTTEALQFKGKKHSLCMLVPLGNAIAVEFGELPS